jgi:pilus assembly protein Flp/PilA
MARLLHLGKRLVRDTRGATAIEYGLVAALMVIGVLVSIKAATDASIAMWGKVSSRVQDATK